ncbi:MAG TPA: hypothetical protein VM533_05570 [Fimbriiglobus sp.]|jgi:hypothetical protein|nr:hypothetical protein [Fimbriiglobus sp.]
MPPPSRPVQLAILFAAAALPAAFTLDPKFDHDTWWHLRVGQLVADTGSVPDTDPFTRLGQERPTPWVAYSWLYEWGLFKTYAAFGEAGIVWARTLLGAASTAAVFVLMPNRGWRMAPAALLAGVAMMPLMKERPWHLTIVFTALTIGVVKPIRDGSPASRAWWLTLVYAVWANVHVQFVMGWLVLGLACTFPGRARRRSLMLLTAGCVLATLCNPYFARLHVVVLEYAIQTGPLRTVQELAPPDPSSPWLWAVLGLLGWSGVVAVRRRPIDWFEAALIVVALVLTLRMRRDVWFAAVTAGVVLRQAGTVPVDQLSKKLVVGVVTAAFVAIRLLNLAGLGPPNDIAAANERAYPVRSAAFVRDRELPGPLFNSFDWGGYLIWSLPTHPVSIDGRTNLYGSERVTRAMSTWAGGPGWDADPDLTSAKLVIAPRELPLTGLLRGRPGEWQVAFEDETVVVFVAVGR